jgi:DNA topoisomerase VI subunit A
MKRLNLTLDDITCKNLKVLAALKETSIARLIKSFVDMEFKNNPDECELCRKYGHEPNAETVKALKESRKLVLSKAIPGKEAIKRFDKEFGGR